MTIRLRFVGDLPGYSRALCYRAMQRLRPSMLEPAAAIASDGFDLVTIVFKLEIDLLALQARSFDRFLDPAFKGRIIVVVNDLSCKAVTKQIETNILLLYGRWRDRVTIVPFHILGHRLDPSNGWIIQQALKLAASRLIARPYYVVFDAKNHLVGPTSVDRFVDENGLAQQAFVSGYVHLPRHDETCARYFELEAHDSVRSRFVPMTPFVFHTCKVRDLMRHIEERENCCIEAFFCKRRFMSEFMLYGAYLDARCGGTALHYRDAPHGRITIWPSHNEAALVAEAEASGAYCFGVHREHLAAIAPAQIQLLEKFWRRVGLLADDETFRGLAMPRAPAKVQS